MEYQNFNYTFVRNILENKITKQEYKNESNTKKTLPIHENIRGKEYYEQQTINFNNNGSN